MWILAPDDYEIKGGVTRGVTVYEDNSCESLVLDQNGTPFTKTKQIKVGFDLTPSSLRTKQFGS